VTTAKAAMAKARTMVLRMVRLPERLGRGSLPMV